MGFEMAAQPRGEEVPLTPKLRNFGLNLSQLLVRLLQELLRP